MRALGVYFRCQWGIFTWTWLSDHGNIRSSKKPKIAVKFSEHFDWVNTSSIWRKWRPTESDVRHKSKGWTNTRRRSKSRSKINFHQNKLKKKTATKLTPRNAPQQRAYMMRADLLHCPITSMKRTLSFQWSNSPEIENFASVLINNMI